MAWGGERFSEASPHLFLPFQTWSSGIPHKCIQSDGFIRPFAHLHQGQFTSPLDPDRKSPSDPLAVLWWCVLLARRLSWHNTAWMDQETPSASLLCLPTSCHSHPTSTVHSLSHDLSTGPLPLKMAINSLLFSTWIHYLSPHE